MNKTMSCLLCTAVALLGITASAQMGPVMPNQSQIVTLPTTPSASEGKVKPVLAGMPAQPEDSMRDPFWPIGFAPPTVHQDVGPVVAPTAAPQERNWEQAQKGLAIKGIIKSGNAYVATINNQIVGQSEKISVFYDGQKYTWRISSISAKSVQFQPDETASEQKTE